MPEPKFPHVFPDGFRLPAPAQKTDLTADAGISLGLSAAEIVRRARAEKRLAVIVCADAGDMIKLADELTWFDPTLRVSVLPDWETLPYDTMSPHEDLVSERLETLWKLVVNAQAREKGAESKAHCDVILTSAATASQRLAPPSFILGSSFFYKKGQQLDVGVLRTNLVQAGYGSVEQVMAPGEFCVRGGIVDVFPMGSQAPFRLDLFDDEIETLRTFDTETQRSGDDIDEIRILPGHEFPMDEAARNAFRSAWRETFPGDPNKSVVYKDMGQGIAAAGIEYYLPLFFKETATLADYLPADTLIVLSGDVNQALTRFHTEITDRWRFLSHDEERPALAPERIADAPDAFFTHLARFARLALKTQPAAAALSVTVNRNAADPFAGLKTYLTKARLQKRRVLICTTSTGRTARIEEMLAQNDFKMACAGNFTAFLESTAPLMMSVGPAAEGFEAEAPAIALITENELYDVRAVKRRSRIKDSSTRVEAVIRDISELKPGDPVVHLDHGVGRYVGLESLTSDEGPSEFVRIDYANDAKLYVPVSQLHLISRYTGADAEHAPMHSLGRGDWEKAKKKAAQKVRDTAAELLNLYAVRESRKGFAFEKHAKDYEAFCEGFAFEETPDQAAAIDAVIGDMLAAKPMDRLVCGDVGFGKTEVALRAAFVAAMNGKQVAVLCPTTLLAEQHAQTFRDRFAAWPVKIAELSRFRSGKETTQAIEGLKAGTIDIAVGTHKLLSEKVEFARLGLVVIDEEHRFGVRQKERLKALRAEVDVLTLTATPIPRTLAMSLEGIRDFSVIATAPQKRLAIKTFVRRESDELIREAVIRELKRGGQVYFLHNEVDTIQARFERLSKLLPEARIAVAHGQMGERELEHIMRDFYQQRYNVLLCTTIIETGIDVANANTILIHRADMFGLAQLHQLRGRVGRSHHQAYAYLMTPGEEAITKNAQKRLDAIQNLEDLGSGFYLSMHALEIRGAGEVLGDEQSGEMAQVGFDLYSQMLKSAVKALKRGETPDFEAPFASMSEINLHMPAVLPADYVPDVAVRLGLYKELAAADNLTDLERTIDDINDRFGRLPDAAKALIAVHRLRIAATRIGISKIDAADTAIVFTFKEKPRFEPIALIKLLQSRRDLKMLGPQKMRMTAATTDLETRLRAIRTITNPLLAASPETE